jgi:hypothetical protein
VQHLTVKLGPLMMTFRLYLVAGGSSVVRQRRISGDTRPGVGRVAFRARFIRQASESRRPECTSAALLMKRHAMASFVQ